MKKAIRKIHLWLSVPFGIIITLTCFSGMALVFEKEITEKCRHEVYFVKEVKESPLPIKELMEQVAATLPDSVAATGLTIGDDPRRTWQVSLSKPRRASLFVDPYTGEVTGRSEKMPFFDAMFRLHRWLMGSSSGIGKTLVGVSTGAMVVILITGILMWLTNRRRPLAKSLKISVRKGRHRFLHDLHVAGGIYAFIFLIVFALTGLTWSFTWYRTGFYRLFGVQTSADAVSPQPSAVSRQRSAVSGQHQGVGLLHGAAAPLPHKTDNPHKTHKTHLSQPYAHWQEVYDTLAMQHTGYRQISISDGKASVVPSGRNSLRCGDTFDFDPHSGAITGSHPYAQQDKSSHVRSAVYTLHTGTWGGITTRILAFLAALVGATLPLTGYYLWLRRIGKRR